MAGGASRGSQACKLRSSGEHGMDAGARRIPAQISSAWHEVLRGLAHSDQSCCLASWEHMAVSTVMPQCCAHLACNKADLARLECADRGNQQGQRGCLQRPASRQGQVLRSQFSWATYMAPRSTVPRPSFDPIDPTTCVRARMLFVAGIGRAAG